MQSNPFTTEFVALKEKFSFIQHYQRMVDTNTKEILKKLSDDLEGSEELEGEWRELTSHSYSNFYYPDPLTGSLVFYSHKKTNIEETVKMTYLFKNRQYQWLLSEAYEAFEDFVECVYVHCGLFGSDFWHPNHKKKIPNTSDGSCSQAMLKTTSSQLRVSEILNRLREKIPEIGKKEKTASGLGHIRFYLALIEKLRHVIVHANGVTSSKEKLVTKILHNCNVSGDKELEPIARQSIGNYFGSEEYSNHILLLEHNIKIDAPIAIQINRQEFLSNKLLSYSHLLALTISEHFLKPE